MRNIKLLIEYDGTNFSGWQEQRVRMESSPPQADVAGNFGVQPLCGWEHPLTQSVDSKKPLTPSMDSKVRYIPTIQACLREAIHKVTGEWVVVYGASRTDAGVHALGQVANFKTSSRLPAERLVPALNYYLPREIVVRSAGEVPEEFHAQFHARSKVYRYTILNDPVPRAINRDFYYHFHYPLDVERMKEAAQYLLGRHDFRAFCVEAHNKENTIRTIKSLEILESGPPQADVAGNFGVQSASGGCGWEYPLTQSVDSKKTLTPSMLEARHILGGDSRTKRYVHFFIEADGFLHKMIRGIVGTLLLVGSGKMGLAEFKGVVEARDRSLAGPTVPARGLCLLKVNYTENGTWPG